MPVRKRMRLRGWARDPRQCTTCTETLVGVRMGRSMDRVTIIDLTGFGSLEFRI